MSKAIVTKDPILKGVWIVKLTGGSDHGKILREGWASRRNAEVFAKAHNRLNKAIAKATQ